MRNTSIILALTFFLLLGTGRLDNIEGIATCDALRRIDRERLEIDIDDVAQIRVEGGLDCLRGIEQVVIFLADDGQRLAVGGDENGTDLLDVVFAIAAGHQGGCQAAAGHRDSGDTADKDQFSA